MPPLTESHASLKSHRWNRRQYFSSTTWRYCFCFALSQDAANERSVTSVLLLFHFIRHVRWLADGASDGFVLGVVRDGFAWSFLFGVGCSIRHGWHSFQFARLLCLVSFSSCSIHRQYGLQRANGHDTWGLVWHSLICEIGDSICSTLRTSQSWLQSDLYLEPAGIARGLNIPVK